MTCWRSSASNSLERQLDVPGVVAMDHLVVGDGDDHRHGLPLGQQVVHHEVHAAVVDPVVGQVAAAAHQVEHRVGLRAVVAGRRVDVQLALAVRHVGVIDVARHRAVRHVAGVVVGRAVAVHDQLAVRRHGGERPRRCCWDRPSARRPRRGSRRTCRGAAARRSASTRRRRPSGRARASSWPSAVSIATPASETLRASGAFSRNVTVRSSRTSGELSGALNGTRFSVFFWGL